MTSTAAPEELSEPEDEVRAGEVESTHHGQALTWAEAAAVARRQRTTFVCLAGLEGWGKTTLLSALYELFQWGPVGQAKFAGSLTLIGFEERRHDTRIASRRYIPHVERTYRGADAALHLRLTVGRRPIEILFADLPGERFEAVCNNNSALNHLGVLRRSDHFSLLVDAGLLADPTARHLCRYHARTLLRATLANKMLPGHAQIQIVLTKADLLRNGGADATHAVDEALSDLGGLARAAGRVTTIVRTSALVPIANGQRDPGVVSLLELWSARLPPWSAGDVSAPPSPVPTRSFGRFLTRGEAERR